MSRMSDMDMWRGTVNFGFTIRMKYSNQTQGLAFVHIEKWVSTLVVVGEMFQQTITGPHVCFQRTVCVTCEGGRV